MITLKLTEHESQSEFNIEFERFSDFRSFLDHFNHLARNSSDFVPMLQLIATAMEKAGLNCMITEHSDRVSVVIDWKKDAMVATPAVKLPSPETPAAILQEANPVCMEPREFSHCGVSGDGSHVFQWRSTKFGNGRSATCRYCGFTILTAGGSPEKTPD